MALPKNGGSYTGAGSIFVAVLFGEWLAYSQAFIAPAKYGGVTKFNVFLAFVLYYGKSLGWSLACVAFTSFFCGNGSRIPVTVSQCLLHPLAYCSRVPKHPIASSFVRISVRGVCSFFRQIVSAFPTPNDDTHVIWSLWESSCAPFAPNFDK